VQVAEAAGFDAAMCSDHWAPWSDEQGESGFAWSWLGAALEATSLSLGVVNAPGQRYHPAIIAQAAATLGVMYPDRFWVALGSGQLLNEHITGEPWPIKSERNERLREAARRHAPAVGGRDGHPLRSRDRFRGETLGAPRAVSTAGRRGGHARDRRLGRRMGRCAHHHPPTRRNQ